MHDVSEHKQGSKQWLVTVFIQKGGENLFLEINAFKAIFFQIFQFFRVRITFWRLVISRCN